MSTLSRTTGTPTLGTKFTCSAWFKFSELPGGSGSDRWLFGEYTDSSNHSYLYLRNSSAIGWYEQASGSTVVSKITNQFLKDTSGWYHIMVAFDTTDGTAEDRFKLYINGNRVSDWGTSTNTYGSSATPRLNSSGKTFYIGKATGYGSGQNFIGSMSHFHFCDGTALAQSVFGETDSTTGIWKIKASPSFTPGNNGFTILKDDNTITDQSANSNNFTQAAGTTTKTEDCPSNVFTTFNVLLNENSGGTFSNGATKYTTVSSKHDFAVSTLGMNSGKYYAEFKILQDTDYNIVGISDHGYQGSNQELSEDNYSYAYWNDTGGDGKVRANGTNVLTGMPDFGNGDIIGVAVDLDNHKLYFSKNGTFINSGVPTSGSTGTGAVSIQNLSSVSSLYGQGTYFFAAGLWNNSNSGNYEANFGNGYFGTTAVSSAGTNASGFGVFEYDVPTGYTALCTKGLNS